MSLKDLTTAVMFTISARWLDPKQERPLLEGAPHLAPLVKNLDEAHAGLLANQKRASASSAALAQLDQRALELDARHDRLARATHGLLTGLADLTDDDEERAAITTARDALLPEGLLVINKSYTDEAGAAALARARLSPASRKLLKSTSVAGVSLHSVVERWLGAARELGGVESERISLRGKPADAPTAADVARARNAWIRVVSAMLTMLELDRTLDDAERARILEPLEAAQAKAGKRAARGKGEASGEGDGAGAAETGVDEATGDGR